MQEDRRSGWSEIRRVPLLRDLALVVALAAALAALVDYLLKAEVVSWFGKGEPLVRFFGFFYGGTALAAFLLQALLGRRILARIGLGGSVTSHPLLVGAAGLVSFVAPAPWRATAPRRRQCGNAMRSAKRTSERRCGNRGWTTSPPRGLLRWSRAARLRC